MKPSSLKNPYILPKIQPLKEKVWPQQHSENIKENTLVLKKIVNLLEMFQSSHQRLFQKIEKGVEQCFHCQSQKKRPRGDAERRIARKEKERSDDNQEIQESKRSTKLKRNRQVDQQEAVFVQNKIEDENKQNNQAKQVLENRQKQEQVLQTQQENRYQNNRNQHLNAQLKPDEVQKLLIQIQNKNKGPQAQQSDIKQTKPKCLSKQNSSKDQESIQVIKKQTKQQKTKQPTAEIDYKDKFVEVQSMNFDSIIEKAQLKQLNKNNQNDNSSMKHSQNMKALIKTEFDSEFASWTTRLLDSVSKSSFYGFINKKMDKNNTKAYFSRNSIRHIIKLKQQLIKRQEFDKSYTQNLIKMFNDSSKESLKFLKLKYPQQEKILFDTQISKMIPEMKPDQFQISAGFKYLLRFSHKDMDAKAIKQFINNLIDETNSKHQLFKRNLKLLFKDKSNNDMAENTRFSYLIGTKIKVNTPLYTEQEIEDEGLDIKSGEIMRIIIKWIQNIQDYIKQTVNDRAQKLKNDRQRMSEQQLKMNNILTNPKWLQQHKQKGLNEFASFGARTLKQFIQAFRSVFKSIDQDQYKTNFFSSLSSLQLGNIVSKYLIELHKMLPMFLSKYDNPCFKILDLFRGKCSGSYKEIKQVYENIKKSNIFHIVQVKNRINTSNRDYLLNMTMVGTSFTCQLQLHISSGSQESETKRHRGQCQNQFNHFLYQLQRSKFGSVAEMVSVYSLLSDLPGFFSLDKLNTVRSKIKVKKLDDEINCHITPKYDAQIQGKLQSQYQQNSVDKLSTLNICSQCLYIFHSCSTKCWTSKVTNKVVCEVCLVDKLLTIQDKMKIFFNQFYSNFCEFNPSSFPLYFVRVHKSTHKIQRYSIKQNKFRKLFSKKTQTKNQLMDKHQDYYWFKIDDNEVIKTIVVTQQSPLLSLISQEDIKLLNIESSLRQQKTIELSYIQPQQQAQSKQIYIMCSTAKINHTQSDMFEILEWIEQQPVCFSPNVKDYRLFKQISHPFVANLNNIYVDAKLDNFPCLNILSLNSLTFKLKCPLQQIDFNNLKLNKIKQLKITFYSASQYKQVFEINRLKSSNLTNLTLEFYEFIDLHVQYYNQKSAQNVLAIKNQEHENNKQRDIEAEYQNQNTLPQLQIFNVFMAKPRKRYPKIFGQIDISITHQRLQDLKIGFSLDTTINLNGSQMTELKSFEINNIQSRSSNKVKLIGFEQKDKVLLPKLQKIKFTDLSNINLEYLPFNKLARFVKQTSQQNQQKQEQDQTKYPLEHADNLSHLFLSTDNYLELKIKSLEKLEELTVYNKAPQCFVIRDLYPKGLHNIKKLTLNSVFDCKPDNIIKIELKQQLNQLQELRIFRFKQVIIKSELFNLTNLELEQVQFKQLDLTSLKSAKLSTLSIFTCQNLQSIKINCQEAMNLKKIDLKNMKKFPRFEGVRMAKNYFWRLQSLIIANSVFDTHDFKYWNQFKIEQSQQEIKKEAEELGFKWPNNE